MNYQSQPYYYNYQFPVNQHQDGDRFFFFPFGALLLGGLGGAALGYAAARPRPYPYPVPYPVYQPYPYSYGYNQYSGYNYY